MRIPGTRPARHARWALAVVFAANGVYVGTLAARVPAIKDRLEVSRLGYFGFLVGPPVIGFTAEAVGLTAALAVIPLLTLTLSALSGAVDPPSPIEA